jgi:hypothetical protein
MTLIPPDPNAAPVVPAADPPKADPPKPAAQPLVDANKVRANAEYYARHPEELEGVLNTLEQAGHIHVNQRIDSLQREIDMRDVIADHGLSREDADFLTGKTKQELIAQAAKLKARYDSLKGTAPAPTGNEKVTLKVGTMRSPEPVNTPPPPPQMSEIVRGRGGVPSVEAAEAALYKDMERISFES